MRKKQGVAQRVIDEITERRNAEPHNRLLSGAREGAAYLHAELSAEARAMLVEYEHRIRSEGDIETQVIISRKRDAVRDAFKRLGLDLEKEDQ